MTLGKSPEHADLFRSSAAFCDEALGETSIYRLLHVEAHRLFPDESFADLFTAKGRRSIPPRMVAVVMVLQRFEGLSDREAVEHFLFDLRWKYAAGGLDYDHKSFVHTVLVDMRARLRASARPDRIFEAVLDVAKKAGLIGRRRVLDSTALYDAVATQDTVTLIRSAICGVLRTADVTLAATLRDALRRDDPYDRPGKPSCDWEDAVEREALVDALARDGQAILARLDGLEPGAELRAASTLLATVLGQDIEERADGVFAIARRVAPDRVISTVDPEARHGHKTASRGFDGYKGHVALDPESELVTATAVTAANVGDGSVAGELIADLLAATSGASTPGASATEAAAELVDGNAVTAEGANESAFVATDPARPSVQVYGDASYGSGEVLEKLERAGIEANVKVMPPTSRGGCFTQEAFVLDRAGGTATCPAGAVVALRTIQEGQRADFSAHCEGCALRDKCTTSPRGRMLNVHPNFELLRNARVRQRSPEWKTDYKATRPKVERKLAHLVRRKHGGRRARLRGRLRVAHDFALVAAATNLARLAVLGLRHDAGAWSADRGHA
jgi:Transposase DDE domain/Transposase domain (DUF772)